MGVRNGPFRAWHVNAIQAEEAYYKNGELDSIRRIWDNLIGTIISQEYYKEGKKDGVWIKFDQLGDTSKLMTYRDDLLDGKYYEKIDGNFEAKGMYKEGKKHGFWETGQVSNYRRQSGTYEMGEKIGEWTYYDGNGELLMVEDYKLTFEDGVPSGTIEAFYDNGKMKSKLTLEEGLIEGEYYTYHYNGKPEAITQYSDGFMNGKRVTFTSKGDTLSVSHYEDDILEGLYYSKYDGKVDDIGHFSDGKRSGPWKENLVSGDLRQEGEYKNDLRVGEWVVFNVKGKPMRKDIYADNGIKKKTIFIRN